MICACISEFGLFLVIVGPCEQMLALREAVSKEVRCVRRFEVESLNLLSGEIGKYTNRLHRSPRAREIRN